MVLCNQWQTCFCPFTLCFCSFFALPCCFLHFGFRCTWIRGCAFYCKDQPSINKVCNRFWRLTD